MENEIMIQQRKFGYIVKSIRKEIGVITKVINSLEELNNSRDVPMPPRLWIKMDSLFKKATEIFKEASSFNIDIIHRLSRIYEQRTSVYFGQKD